jgi:5-methylcytosine-specific restriction protein A
MEILKKIQDKIQGKVPSGTARSSKWAKIRDQHLQKNPLCAVCGGNKDLQVHHKKPFHLHPELELDPNNLVTLCEALKKGINCHLLIGHLGNFKNVNEEVDQDVESWSKKLSKAITRQSKSSSFCIGFA